MHINAAGRHAEKLASDSPAARSKRKRTASSCSDDGDTMVAPKPKVFRLHAFGGETAHATGRAQLSDSHLAARSLFQSSRTDPKGNQEASKGGADDVKGTWMFSKGSTDGADGNLLCTEDLDMNMWEDDSKSQDAAAALVRLADSTV